MAVMVRLALALGLLGALGGAARAQSDLDSFSTERLELSGFLGLHLSSDTSALGARADSAASIASSVALGPRLTYLFRDWLLFESELAIAPSNARDSSVSADVLVIEPRLAARFETRRKSDFTPFVTVGLGVPIALSDNNRVLRSDLSLRPQLGAGALLLHDRDLNLRFDARLFAAPARDDSLVTPELELTLSVYFVLGARRPPRSRTRFVEERDSDGDGVPDPHDQCPERQEDRDGHEDADGCPDIDNDLDLVLDIADRCPNEPESHNGFQDDDGCPDQLPSDLRRVIGRVRGLVFRSRSARLTSAGRRALRRVARIMTRYPSVRIVLTGYTDDREVRRDSAALSIARARAVREFLVRRKIRAWRIKIAGRGAKDPVANNRTRRGRAQNRRVMIELRVYGPSR